MATSMLNLPIDIVQDLVRLQGEEIIRMRRELMESQDLNERLSQKLADAEEEIRQMRAVLMESTPAADAPLQECFAEPNEDDDSKSVPTIRDSEDVLEEDVHSEVATVASIVDEATSSSELYNPTISTESGNLRPFCHRQSPFKCIAAARPQMPSGVVLFPAMVAEFQFSSADKSEGFLVKATCRCDGYDASTSTFNFKTYDRWKKTRKPFELLTSERGEWFYFGTYEIEASTSMNKEAFNNLPKKVKRELAKFTAADHTDGIEKLLSMYKKGELLANKTDIRRVGFNIEVEHALLAAGENFGNE